MRRTFLPFVLSLLFVCAQQAGLVHAIGHASDRFAAVPAAGFSVSPGTGAVAAQQPGDLRTADGSEAGSYCDKCFQFAHFAGAAFAFVLPALAFDPVRETPQARPVALAIVDAPAFRSRGPPVVL
jgi:hypothetical protein